MSERFCGKDHRGTLSILHRIADIFRKKGRFDEALEWYRRMLAGNEKSVGKDHPDTLLTV